ncbi:MAG TPA: transcription termination/antitermination factor NusG [Planctomycetales bacterium]|jgi:transcriptional antiterminator NusG|nr:transcription termination/antitermination factor NusG [Planctomycetales bacterium]
MSDNVLTSEPETASPALSETVAANDAAPHDVAPPEHAERDEARPAHEKHKALPIEVSIEEEPEPEAAARQEEAPAAEEEEEDDDDADAEAAAEPVAEEEPSNKHWYVVKVQSGREDTIKEAIERRVKIERLEEYFGEIKIPVERVTEMRNSKRVVKERKLYPGYLMANVEYNDHILYLFRETSGVGDFVGGTLNRPPPPMSPREVDRMLGPKGGGADKEKALPEKPPVDKGDRVRVRDGTFAGMEGEVKDIIEALNHLKVELTIFGRPVPVELEYWQVEVV